MNLISQNSLTYPAFNATRKFPIQIHVTYSLVWRYDWTIKQDERLYDAQSSDESSVPISALLQVLHHLVLFTTLLYRN